MLSIAHLRSSVEKLLAETTPELSRATRERLVFFLIGVLLAGSIVLRRLATTHSHISLGTTVPASHERRLRRCLNEPALAAVPMYGRVVRRVLRRLPADKRLTVILDESGHSTVVRALIAALWYRGRALPLAWILWGAYVPHQHSYWSDCERLLEQVATLLPAQQPITVLADRAFGCPGFTDLVVEQGWDYLVRVQGQTRLRQSDGSQSALRELLPGPGTRFCGRGQAFKKQGWRALSVVAYWRAPCCEPLLLVSSLAPSWELVRQYRLRSAIEAMFRDWKSSGWQWEACQVRELEHQKVLILILALATLLTLSLGEEAAEQVLEQARQSGQRRPWHARESLFRLGRDRLWQRLWQQDTSEVRWELEHFAAPNWSQECWQASRPKGMVVYESGRLGRREQRRKLAA